MNRASCILHRIINKTATKAGQQDLLLFFCRGTRDDRETKCEDQINNLGKKFEKNATKVTFDLSAIATDHPDATYTLFHKRAGDEESYRVAQFAVEDGHGSWLVDDKDTAVDGYGEAEIVIEDEDYRKKSVTYKTLVMKSITSQEGGE